MSKYSICKCQNPTFFIYGTTLICSRCREIKIYLAVVNEWNNISLMYSEDELNMMREIQ